MAIKQKIQYLHISEKWWKKCVIYKKKKNMFVIKLKK